MRDYIREYGLRDRYPVFWTRDVVAEDVGRNWLTERGLEKQISPPEMEH